MFETLKNTPSEAKSFSSSFSPASSPGIYSRPARQQTLSRPVTCEGVGLHCGQSVKMRLVPAPAGTGIVFCRTDLPFTRQLIPALYDRVADTRLSTVIANDAGARVATIEHLMAALWAAEIDNVMVELDGPEVPAMDGSALPFLTLLEQAETIEQAAPRRALTLSRPVRLEDGDAWIEMTPSPRLEIAFTIEFDSAAIARQSYEFGGSPAIFRQDLAQARTFGFIKDVEQLRANGLALGGSLENAVVVDGDTVLNPEGLRYEDEFVRHKILDLVGDFYLAGAPIVARIEAFKSGHALNNRALHALYRQMAAASPQFEIA